MYRDVRPIVRPKLNPTGFFFSPVFRQNEKKREIRHRDRDSLESHSTIRLLSLILRGLFHLIWFLERAHNAEERGMWWIEDDIVSVEVLFVGAKAS